jgi:hypothetical protein
VTATISGLDAKRAVPELCKANDRPGPRRLRIGPRPAQLGALIFLGMTINAWTRLGVTAKMSP